MPRFMCLIVSLVAIAAAACEKTDGLYCSPTDMTTRCTSMIDAMPPPPPPPPACTDDTGCKSATEPVCDVAGGEGVCVVCTTTDHALCKDTTPICSDHTCQACRSSSDCPLSDICLASGACADEGDVAYVDPKGGDTASCTKALPCMKVASGLATVTALETPRPYLKLHGAITEAVTISRNVTVFADSGASLTRGTNGAILTVNGTAVAEINDLTITSSRSGTDPGIFADGTTALTLKRVTVSANKGNGVSCAGNSLTVSGSMFSDNDAIGISCTRGSVAVTASTFTNNAGGGMSLAGGSFDVTNNFLYGNGDKDRSEVGGVFLNPMTDTTNRFEFNTVVDNHVKDFITVLTAGVLCDLPGFTAPNNIISGNVIHDDATRANANTAGRCTYPTSALNAPVADLKFVSPDGDPRDYHLQAGSIAIGAATTATMVITDFDGDARTAATNDQGADQRKP